MKHIKIAVPDRVIINKHGEAVQARKAYDDFGIISDIIFMRDDGWTLGASCDFEELAYRMHRNEWLYFARKPGMHFSSIDEYEPVGKDH